jgi:ABC-type antimicrobial peptide transport system permease subunit
MVGALAVAVAVASALTLAIIVRSFNGAVVGSFLGDAVALQVRGPDIAAVVVLAVLGLVAVATVLLLALVEDAPSFAALRAAGWTDLALNTALAAQATAIGLSGAILGAGLALLGTALFIGPVTTTILGLAVVATAAAVVATTAASLAPAVLLSRLPTARILARD